MIQNMKVGWTEDDLQCGDSIPEKLFDETYKKLATHGSLQPSMYVYPKCHEQSVWLKDYICKTVI